MLDYDRNLSKKFAYRPDLNKRRLIEIADADLKTCEALGVVLRLEGFQSTFSNYEKDVIANVQRRKPDAILLGMHRGKESSLSLLLHLTAMKRSVPIIMLADAVDIRQAVTAMQLGAHDVLSKPIDTEYLVSMLRARLGFDAQPAFGVSGECKLDSTAFPDLTGREREVIELIANGRTNKAAARELGISSRTVEVYRARAMLKMGARNVADLVRIILAQ